MAQTALAVLPLIISAAEHYTFFSSSLARYCRFSHEVSRLLKELHVQKELFRLEARQLLSACTADTMAKEMLDNPQHPNWEDSTYEQILLTHLGETKDPIVDAMSLIKSTLTSLQVEADKYASVLENNHECFGDRQWRRRIGRKIELAFTEPQFSENIKSLRLRTQDLGALRAHTEKIQEVLFSRPPPPSSMQKDIENYTIVQRASQSLYIALSTACTKHMEHYANFGLQPDLGGKTTKAKFNIASWQRANPSGIHSKPPIWFTVQSSITCPALKDISNVSEDISHLRVSLKRKEVSPPSSLTKRRPEPQETSKENVQSHSPTSSLPQLAVLANSPNLPDLCKHNNFCNNIQNLICGASSNENCVGFLETDPGIKHLLYLDDASQSTPGHPIRSEPMSLITLLSRRSESTGRGGKFPEYQRCKAARILATAVLQLHSTSWLSNSWNSRDIFFHDTNNLEPTQILEKKQPFVDVSLKNPSSPPSDGATLTTVQLAQNPLLFRLGVLLLELAFEAPFSSMRQSFDRERPEDCNAEFITARRVSHTASSMGSQYSKIIRKCLNCHFANGDDLTSPALQEEFYRDVVCELSRLENGFRNPSAQGPLLRQSI